MIIKTSKEIPGSEITPESHYQGRRAFLREMGYLGAGLLAGGLYSSASRAAVSLGEVGKSDYGREETLTSLKDITGYNNFYEFGTRKEDPAKHAHILSTDPWSIRIEGEVSKPGNYTLEDILRPHAFEERIYRLRCVEGWSMVIPWVGFPLADLIKRFEPTSRARFVEFVTLHDPKQMPGQRWPVLDWPYVEGLRMDEAMNPLSLLAVGLYGEVMPKQNGAPIRLVVPWKYGFKSIKSIVAIRFRETQPMTSWVAAAKKEYGFYSNVNPEVDHPRWSQRKERRIGELRKRKTLMFNGYGEQVAHLYQGMDLRKHF